MVLGSMQDWSVYMSAGAGKYEEPEHTVVVHRDKRPVGDDTSDADGVGVARGRCWTRNEVFNSRGVEQLDVGELQHLGEKG